MYEISITTHFSAAHHLVAYDGACADPHGHNWEIIVYLRGTDLDRLGILVDFRKVKNHVKRAIDELDHADLNKLPAFAKVNPTSENIARHLYDKLSTKLNGTSYSVARVTVAETPGNKVTYWNELPDKAPRKAKPGRR
ncbi:MAG: 6-carboxytetrahydropterin synthase QueD [bacterium]